MNLEYASVDDVIPGDQTAIELLAQGWTSLGATIADGASSIDSTGTPTWKGSAADAFAQRVATVPGPLREMSGLLAEAVDVLHGWLDDLATAQASARDAIDRFQEGKAQHRWWLENHGAIEAATGVPVPDPGLDVMAAAERQADQLRADLDATATAVSQRLRAIADVGFDRFSRLDDLAHTVRGVLSGTGEAMWELGSQLSLMSPLRWAFDGEGAGGQVGDMWAGIEAGTRLWFDDTEAFVEQGLRGAFDVDGLISDPASWAGHFVPDLVASAVGLGAARRGTRLLDNVIPDIDGGVVAYPGGSGSMVEGVLDGLETGRQRTWVRVVDKEDDAWLLFLRISQGGDPISGTTREGPFVRLPDGTTVGIRPTSISGGVTIDIQVPNRSPWRVHVK